MKNKEETEPDYEKDITHYNQLIFGLMRKLVKHRKTYQFLLLNKKWILILLLILSIVRSYIWYSLFGINILYYSSFQDIFISFADNFISIITMSLLVIFNYFLIPSKPIGLVIFTVIIDLLFLWLFLSLFCMIISIIGMIFMVSFVLTPFIISKTTIGKFYGIIIFLFMFSFFQPIEQYVILNKRINNSDHTVKLTPRLNYKVRTANYDFISFDYNNIHIDTKDNFYFLIGSSTDYYFILDRHIGKALIIPKNECKNISSHLFGMHDFLIIGPLFNE